MVAKSLIVFSVLATVQIISAQCIPEAIVDPINAVPACGPYYPNNYGLELAPAGGRGFGVISYSPIAPTGIIVQSENAIEGAVSVIGELPFVSAVVLESILPTAGVGAINYGCGNGAVGIVAENINPIAPVYGNIAAGYGPGVFAPGLNTAYGPGCGY